MVPLAFMASVACCVLLVSNYFGISLNMHQERGGLRFAPLAVVELIVVFL